MEIARKHRPKIAKPMRSCRIDRQLAAIIEQYKPTFEYGFTDLLHEALYRYFVDAHPELECKLINLNERRERWNGKVGAAK